MPSAQSARCAPPGHIALSTRVGFRPGDADASGKGRRTPPFLQEPEAFRFPPLLPLLPSMPASPSIAPTRFLRERLCSAARYGCRQVKSENLDRPQHGSHVRNGNPRQPRAHRLRRANRRAKRLKSAASERQTRSAASVRIGKCVRHDFDSKSAADRSSTHKLPPRLAGIRGEDAPRFFPLQRFRNFFPRSRQAKT